MKKLMISAFVLLMASCMQAPQTDLEGLKATIDVSQSAFDARDPTAIAAIYAEDGAVMFAVSDIFVARDRFVSPSVANRLWGLPLYYAAQLIFALSTRNP